MVSGQAYIVIPHILSSSIYLWCSRMLDPVPQPQGRCSYIQTSMADLVTSGHYLFPRGRRRNDSSHLCLPRTMGYSTPCKGSYTPLSALPTMAAQCDWLQYRSLHTFKLNSLTEFITENNKQSLKREFKDCLQFSLFLNNWKRQLSQQ